jgi:hypothetical protein
LVWFQNDAMQANTEQKLGGGDAITGPPQNV